MLHGPLLKSATLRRVMTIFVFLGTVTVSGIRCRILSVVKENNTKIKIHLETLKLKEYMRRVKSYNDFYCDNITLHSTKQLFV